MRDVSKLGRPARGSRAGSPAAANRPSPRAFGGVFDVAAIRVPPATSSPSSRVIIIVSPGSSSSNSSMQMQTRAAEQLDRVRVAERADERRVLDERAEVLPARRERPERGEQVGLADAEAAVEVDAGLRLGRPLAREEPAAARCQPRRRTRAARSTASCCDGIVGIRPVVLERRVLRTAAAARATATISAPVIDGMRSRARWTDAGACEGPRCTESVCRTLTARHAGPRSTA